MSTVSVFERLLLRLGAALLLFHSTGFLPFGEATYDMNLKEMQFVADHLTKKECRKLIEILSLDTFFVHGQPSGAGVPDVSCLRLLLQWDREGGKGQSIVELVIRLKQMGKTDLANELSTRVFGDKERALEKSALENQYKKRIPADDKILSMKDKPAPTFDSAGSSDDFETDRWPAWRIAAVTLGAITVAALIVWRVIVFCKIKVKCKKPKCWIFLRQNAPLYLFGQPPKKLPRELQERKELLLAEARAAGDPRIN